MSSSTAASWTIVHQEDAAESPSDINSLRNALEKGNEDIKIQTMQKILVMMLNGDPLPGLLMHVIRFVDSFSWTLFDYQVMPSKSKPLKKLLHFYWEICPKTNPDGKLKQEMILVWYVNLNDT
jgi:coatomer subunit beta